MRSSYFSRYILIVTVVTKFCPVYLIPIQFLLARYCFLPSLSHIFTFSHSGLTYPHAISCFILHLHYPFYEQRDCCPFICCPQNIFYFLLDTNMVPITYYLTKNKNFLFFRLRKNNYYAATSLKRAFPLVLRPVE